MGNPGAGGRIRVEDRPGGGAVFTFWLPLEAPGTEVELSLSARDLLVIPE